MSRSSNSSSFIYPFKFICIFDVIFYCLHTCIFSHRFYSCVCFKTGMYVYDIRGTLPFLSGLYAISHAATRRCPGTSHYVSEPACLKWVDPFRENDPARQVSQPIFNLLHKIKILFVWQISVIAEMYLKIDFPLNEPAPSQPASYNQALKHSDVETTLGIKIDRKLTFKSHIKVLCTKAGQNLCAFLIGISNYVDQN